MISACILYRVILETIILVISYFYRLLPKTVHSKFILTILTWSLTMEAFFFYFSPYLWYFIHLAVFVISQLALIICSLTFNNVVFCNYVASITNGVSMIIRYFVVATMLTMYTMVIVKFIQHLCYTTLDFCDNLFSRCC